MTYRNFWAICLFVLLITGLVTFGPRLLGHEHQHRLTMEPIRQDQTYHHFADDRGLLGIGNAGDTLSNLAFIAVGVLGLSAMWRERRSSTRFEAPEEMRAYWVLFGALTLTGLGSAYYHQAPNDARLVWDRLPMAIAFMSLLAAIITERVNRTMGVRLLIPLLVLGVGSVVYWAVFEDLWPYYIVQFGSMAMLLVLGALFPSRYTKGGVLFLILAVYAVAKLLETYDREIYELGHWVSGHSLKHVAAACGGYLIMQSVMRRSVRPSGDHLASNYGRIEHARRDVAPGFFRRYWVGVVLVAGGSGVLASLSDVASAATPGEMAAHLALPTLLLVGLTVSFLVVERFFPGRSLPNSNGWYVRSIAINLVQLGVTLGIGRIWLPTFGNTSLVNLSQWNLPILEGFVAWFVGTFVFYWWHRLRHAKGFWEVFHQIHHSASRIEILTSFYKHPIEIFVNAILSSIIIYQVLGSSLTAAFWYNFFAAVGEYFYHANIRSPGWLRYFIQTPELHSIHHQFDVHSFNYGDIPIWDRLFGTYKDTHEFAERCGFPDGAEQRLTDMLLFRDVYDETATQQGARPGHGANYAPRQPVYR